MLDFKVFRDYIKNNLVMAMPKKINNLTFKEVIDDKYSLHIIRNNSRFTKINVTNMYEQYKKGEDINALLDDTAKRVYKELKPSPDKEFKNFILKNSRVGLVELKDVQEGMFWEEFLDYALIYLYEIDKENSRKIITHEIMEDNRITVDEMKYAAMYNTISKYTPRILVFDRYNTFDLIKIPLYSDDDSPSDINFDDIDYCIVTNKLGAYGIGTYGAVSIIFESVINRLVEILGEEFYVIPLNDECVYVLKNDEMFLLSFLGELSIGILLRSPFKIRVYKYNSLKKEYKSFIW